MVHRPTYLLRLLGDGPQVFRPGQQGGLVRHDRYLRITRVISQYGPRGAADAAVRDEGGGRSDLGSPCVLCGGDGRAEVVVGERDGEHG